MALGHRAVQRGHLVVPLVQLHALLGLEDGESMAWLEGHSLQDTLSFYPIKYGGVTAGFPLKHLKPIQ